MTLNRTLLELKYCVTVRVSSKFCSQSHLTGIEIKREVRFWKVQRTLNRTLLELKLLRGE